MGALVPGVQDYHKRYGHGGWAQRSRHLIEDIEPRCKRHGERHAARAGYEIVKRKYSTAVFRSIVRRVVDEMDVESQRRH